MKILSRRTGILAASILVLVFAMSGGCGSDKSTAPDTSTITINPASVSVAGPGGVCSGMWIEQLFAVTVKDPGGTPMNNTAITVTLSYAPNYAQSGIRRMQLYDGATPVDVPYQTVTDDYGIKDLFVRFDVSCVWTGSMEVFSGSAYNSASIQTTKSSQ